MESKIYKSHAGGIKSLAYSSKYKYMAVGSGDGVIRIWKHINDSEFQFLRTLEAHTKSVTALTFTHNGEYLISGGSDTRIIYWHLTSNKIKLEKEYKLKSNGIRDIKEYKNNKLISCDLAGNIFLHNFNEYPTILHTTLSSLYCIESEQNKIYCQEDNNKIAIINEETNEITYIYHKKEIEKITNLLFFKKKNLLAISGEKSGKIFLWSLIDNKLYKTLDAHHDIVTSLCFNNNHSTFYSASDNGEIISWDTNTFEMKYSSNNPSKKIRTLIYTTNNMLISGTSGGFNSYSDSVSVWNNKNEKLILQHEILPNNTWIKSIDTFSNQQLALGMYTDKILLWNRNSTEMLTFSSQKESVWTVSFLNFGKHISFGNKSFEIEIRGSKTGTLIKKISTHECPIRVIKTNQLNTKFVVGDNNGFISLWDSQDFSSLGLYKVSKYAIRAIDFTLKDCIFFGDSNGELGYLNINTGEIISIRKSSGAIRAIIVSPDQKLMISSGYDNIIYIYDIINKKEIISFVAHENWIRSLSINTKGTLLASAADDNTVKVWDLKTYKKIIEWKKHEGWVYVIKFLANSDIIMAGGSSSCLSFFDCNSKKILFKRYIHSDYTYTDIMPENLNFHEILSKIQH